MLGTQGIFVYYDFIRKLTNPMAHRDPQIVKGAYTPDSIWRNRDQFIRGTDEIVAFLTKKWSREQGYRLRKELFAFTDNKVS